MRERGVGSPGRRERGGARLKFLVVLAVIVAAVFVGAQYVPRAYRAWAFESFMQDTVNNAALTDKNPAWVEDQLRKGFEQHGVPEDAAVTSAVNNGRMEATVQFSDTISLLVTDYEYEFDKTVRSTTAVSGAK